MKTDIDLKSKVSGRYGVAAAIILVTTAGLIAYTGITYIPDLADAANDTINDTSVNTTVPEPGNNTEDNEVAANNTDDREENSTGIEENGTQ